MVYLEAVVSRTPCKDQVVVGPCGIKVQEKPLSFSTRGPAALQRARLPAAQIMAGQQLMCVWELVRIEDPDPTPAPGPPVELLRRVTASLKCPSSRFRRSDFDDQFAGSHVPFLNYREYVETTLKAPGCTIENAAQDIQGICWEACRPTYDLDAINCSKDDIYRLWQVFIRLLDCRAYPPCLMNRQVTWVLERAAASLQTCLWHTNLSHQLAENAKYTFSEFMKTLQQQVLSELGAADVQRAVDELHGWLVREICMAGWLEKRTRKFKGTWTPWRRRWFVLTPTKLEYFGDGPGHIKKGEFALKAHTVIKAVLRRKTSLTGRKTMGGFCVSHGGSTDLDLEISPPDMDALKNWMQEIRRVLDAASRKTTPVREVLTAALTERSPCIKTQHSIRRQHQAAANHIRVESGLPELPPLSPESHETEHSFFQLARLIRSSSQNVSPTEGLEHGFLWNTGKLHEVFREADLSNQGTLNREQFAGVLKSLGLTQLDSEQLSSVFDVIVKDGSDELEFSLWLRHLIGVVLGTIHPALRVDILLLSNMHAFTSFIYERQREAMKNHLIPLVSKFSHDKNERKSFRKLFSNSMASVDDEEQSHLSKAPDNFSEVINFSIQEAIVSMDLKETVSLLFDHWKNHPVCSPGDSENNTDAQIVANFLFGVLQQQGNGSDRSENFARVDHCSSSSIQSPADEESLPSPPAMQPSRATWTSVRHEGDSEEDMRYVIPLASHLTIPVVDATPDNLRFYGCSFALEHTRNISLLYSQSMADVTEPNLLSRFYLQKQPTPILMTPLMDDAGILILANHNAALSVIELTGFRLSPGQTVFIPGGHLYGPLYRAGVWHCVTVPDSAACVIPVLTQVKGQLEGISVNIPPEPSNADNKNRFEFITVF